MTGKLKVKTLNFESASLVRAKDLSWVMGKVTAGNMDSFYRR